MGNNRGMVLGNRILGATFGLLAGLLSVVLVAAGLMIAPSAARAAAGTLNSVDMKVLFDGAKVPNDVDDGPNNGLVATNDAVAFQWDFRASDLEGGEFVQSLPEGWSWDPASMGALDTNGSVYRASHTISPDGRVLTAVVSFDTGGGISLLSLSGMKAIPGRSAANGAPYTPEVTATDGTRTLTASASPIAVRGEARVEMKTWIASNDLLQLHDFGDGAGTVLASAIEVNIGIRQFGASTVGVADFELAQPAVIENALTVSTPGYEIGRAHV